MDDSDIYVEHPRLETAAGQLRSHRSSLEDILSTLEGDLKPMLGSWTGEARDLYVTKKNAWDAAAGDLVEVLSHIASITEVAHNNYVTTVSDVGAMWE